jgi:hypothetical protein
MIIAQYKPLRSVRIALGLGYLVIIVQSVSAVYVGNMADKYYLSGDALGVFGRWWAVLWFLNLMIIGGLHVASFWIRLRRKTAVAVAEE